MHLCSVITVHWEVTGEWRMLPTVSALALLIFVFKPCMSLVLQRGVLHLHMKQTGTGGQIPASACPCWYLTHKSRPSA